MSYSENKLNGGHISDSVGIEKSDIEYTEATVGSYYDSLIESMENNTISAHHESNEYLQARLDLENRIVHLTNIKKFLDELKLNDVLGGGFSQIDMKSREVTITLKDVETTETGVRSVGNTAHKLYISPISTVVEKMTIRGQYDESNGTWGRDMPDIDGETPVRNEGIKIGIDENMESGFFFSERDSIEFVGVYGDLAVTEDILAILGTMLDFNGDRTWFISDLSTKSIWSEDGSFAGTRDFTTKHTIQYFSGDGTDSYLADLDEVTVEEYKSPVRVFANEH